MRQREYSITTTQERRSIWLLLQLETSMGEKWRTAPLWWLTGMAGLTGYAIFPRYGDDIDDTINMCASGCPKWKRHVKGHPVILEHDTNHQIKSRVTSFSAAVSTQSRCISSLEDSALTQTLTSSMFLETSQGQMLFSSLALKTPSLSTRAQMLAGHWRSMVYCKIHLQSPNLLWSPMSWGPISGILKRTTLNAARKESPTPGSWSWLGAGRGSSHALMASASGGRHSCIRQGLNGCGYKQTRPEESFWVPLQVPLKHPL